MTGEKTKKLTLLIFAAVTVLYGREARICRQPAIGFGTAPVRTEISRTQAGDTVELAYDDSIFHWEVVDSTNCAYAVRFTPTSYPFQLLSIGFFIGPDRNPYAPFDIKIYKERNGKPDILWAVMGGVTAAKADSFNWFDVSNLTVSVDTGDFFAGIWYTTNYSPYVGTDLAVPPHHRSWGYHDTVWQNFDSISIPPSWPKDSMDLMIRARGILPTGIEETLSPAADLRIVSSTPNPFRFRTDIQFQVPISGYVNFKIYDRSGVRVRTLIAEFKNAGSYSTTWDGNDGRGNRLPTGIYFYQLTCGASTVFKKVILLR